MKCPLVAEEKVSSRWLDRRLEFKAEVRAKGEDL